MPAGAATVIYNFHGADGATPEGALVSDASGALYGTTNAGGAGYGTVFKLTPPAPGKTKWTETVLYSFGGGADGRNPNGGLFIDATGALYGAAGGTVFKLTPTAGGPWTLTSLASVGDLAGALIADASGALYGATVGGGSHSCGTVFKLSPPAAGQAQWTNTVLFNFSSGFANSPDGCNPKGGLIADANGVLYGTTSSGGFYSWGSVFMLTPPGSGQQQWTESTLYSFAGTTPDLSSDDGGVPQGSLIADATGALFGTTVGGGSGPCHTGCGTVYKLSQTGGQGPWSETIIHMFGVPNAVDGRTPQAGLIADGNGALYGTTFSGGADPDGATDGTAFKLTPPAPGKTKWNERVIRNFHHDTGINPLGALLLLNGTLYGTTSAAGSINLGNANAGTVFAAKP